jgi:sulfite reductase (ferredoxin)
MLDLVATLILESKEKLAFSSKKLAEGNWEESIYYSYLTFILGAKALLTGADIKCNTHMGIITDFDEHFKSSGKIKSVFNFTDMVLEIQTNSPSLEFAKSYNAQAQAFYQSVNEAREIQIAEH